MPLIVLNDLGLTTYLFEKRGAIYSHRPRFPMIGELSVFFRYLQHVDTKTYVTVFFAPPQLWIRQTPRDS